MDSPAPSSLLNAEDRVARSLVAGIDPRLRIVVTVVFAVVVVSLRDLVALTAALTLALVLALAAQLPLRATLRRLAAMDVFMALLLVMLPFTVAGAPVARLGPLVASWEGLTWAVRIILTANAVMLALLALVGTLPPATLGHALHCLGVPDKLIHLLLLTVRYVEVLGRELQRLQVAMKARAFRPRSNRHTWRALGHLLGMLLVRSLERSERILAAMKCRGYRGQFHGSDGFRFRPVDGGFVLGAAVALGLLAGLDFW